MVEGKDRPTNAPHLPHVEHGKTTSLCLRLLLPMLNAGKVVIIDSGFCVLLAIIEMCKHGARASALTKNRRNWLKHVKGDEIRNHFEDKNPGDCDCLPGELKGVKFKITCMKESDYTIMLMTSYGTLILPDDAEEKKNFRWNFASVQAFRMH